MTALPVWTGFVTLGLSAVITIPISAYLVHNGKYATSVADEDVDWIPDPEEERHSDEDVCN